MTPIPPLTINGKQIEFSFLNGWVREVDWIRRTHVTGDIGPQSGSISSHHTTSTRVWVELLEENGGGESCFTFDGEIPLRKGHSVTVMIAEQGPWSTYVALFNHTTEEWYLTHDCREVVDHLVLQGPAGGSPLTAKLIFFGLLAASIATMGLALPVLLLALWRRARDAKRIAASLYDGLKETAWSVMMRHAWRRAAS